MSHFPSQVSSRNNEKTLESRLFNLIRKHPIITTTAIILPIFFRACQLNLYNLGTYYQKILEVLEIRKKPIPQSYQPSQNSKLHLLKRKIEIPQESQSQPHYSTNSLEYSSNH